MSRTSFCRFIGLCRNITIPIYQRNYAWKIENCKELIKNLFSTNTTQNIFFGSVVYKNENNIYLIIDGQQRITTISLIFQALRHYAQNHNENDLAAIIKTYLCSPLARNTNMDIKLHLNTDDQRAYENIYLNTNLILDSQITINYNYFYNEISNRGITIDDWLNALDRLQFVEISLEPGDDAQAIFESLNSTGLRLEESDKIRNYLLMNEDSDVQIGFYNNFWHPIEENTLGNVSDFIYQYLFIKTGRSNASNLYGKFKEYCENPRRPISHNAVLEDMCEYSKYYKYVTNPSQATNIFVFDYRITRKLSELRTLQTPIGLSFYMSYLRYEYEESIRNSTDINTQCILKVLNAMESYWGRKLIVGEHLDEFKNMFYTIHNDILHTLSQLEHNRNVDYAEVFKYLILGRTRKGRCPSDTDVDAAFPIKNIYDMRSSHRLFLFERMENGNSNEARDIVSEMSREDSKISIEHILPQTLSQEWQGELIAAGDDPQQVSDRFLHTFANLTLTGYNSTYSNSIFSEKLNCYDEDGNNVGFSASTYYLNESVKCNTQWTSKELQERESVLLERFKAVFPMLTTNVRNTSRYIITIRAEIGEVDDFASHSPLSFELLENNVDVRSWQDLLIKVCSLLCNNTDYSDQVENICKEGTSKFFFKSAGRNRVLFDEERNLYVSSRGTDWDNKKEEAIKELLSALDLGVDALVIEMSLF